MRFLFQDCDSDKYDLSEKISSVSSDDDKTGSDSGISSAASSQDDRMESDLDVPLESQTGTKSYILSKGNITWVRSAYAITIRGELDPVSRESWQSERG